MPNIFGEKTDQDKLKVAEAHFDAIREPSAEMVEIGARAACVADEIYPDRGPDYIISIMVGDPLDDGEWKEVPHWTIYRDQIKAALKAIAETWNGT